MNQNEMNQEEINRRFDDIFGGNNDDDYESGRGTYKASEDTEDNDSHVEVEVFEPETGKAHVELVAKELLNSEDGNVEPTAMTSINSIHASKVHTRCQKSEYVQPIAQSTAQQLEDAIAKDLAAGGDSQDSASTLYFHYDDENQTWCFSGETIGNLLWETDDFEAASEEDAMKQAIDHLEWDYS